MSTEVQKAQQSLSAESGALQDQLTAALDDKASIQAQLDAALADKASIKQALDDTNSAFSDKVSELSLIHI